MFIVIHQVEHILINSVSLIELSWQNAVGTQWTKIVLCKAKMQFLRTCKVTRYCFSALHGDIVM